MKKRDLSIFLFILCIAIFFRFFRLSTVPPSASLDEVTIGYNAYSILHTGSDEYGYKFSLLLRAYDDWRPGLYVYFVIPFTQLFGVDVLSVRLPSAIFSILIVVGTYFLTKELTKNKEITVFHRAVSLEFFPYLTMLLLAISPWHIYISRLGHEVNLGLFCFVYALLFFFRYVYSQSRRNALFLSSGFFAFSLYGYQSQKIIVPFLLIALCLIFRQIIMKNAKDVAIAIGIGILLMLPLVRASFSPDALIRFSATNTFSQNEREYYSAAVKALEARQKNDYFGVVINNRRIITAKIFLSNYASHFNPQWLFTNQNDEKHKVPGLGLLFRWEIVTILIGIVAFFISSIDKRIKYAFFAWIASSPLAAAMTTEAPHAMRSFTFLPSFQIISALGIVTIYSVLLTTKMKKIIFFSVLIVLLITSIQKLYREYFYTFPKSQSSSFQYALSQTIPYVLDNEKMYKYIVFANSGNLYQSYMFFLFHSKFDPAKYRSLGGTISGGYAEQHSIQKFAFRPIEYALENDGTLFIDNMTNIPSGVKIVRKFKNLDGKDAIVVYTK